MCARGKAVLSTLVSTEVSSAYARVYSRALATCKPTRCTERLPLDWLRTDVSDGVSAGVATANARATLGSGRHAAA
jgi:hypothetical protein